MPPKKRVVWDEQNLEENEEYRRLHPVTMHISEPKTPFAYSAFEEEGDFIDALAATEEHACGKDGDDDSTWDAKVNLLARHLKEELAKNGDGPVAPLSASGRPMLSAGIVSGELAEERHAKEFQTMRKAVYADEGAKFKALLHARHEDESDDE